MTENDPAKILNYAGPPPRGQRLIHVAIVLAGAFCSFVLVAFTAGTFGSIRAPEFFLGMLPFSAVSCAVALVMGVARRRSGKWYKVTLALVCMAPPLLIFTCLEINDVYGQITNPGNRFRDNVANPIPDSVGHIRFVPYDESGETDLQMRFAISPSDIEQILKTQGYVRVHPGGLRSPKDSFNDPAHLRIGNADELYQREDKDGDEWTIRVNKHHTSVVFRYQDSHDYGP